MIKELARVKTIAEAFELLKNPKARVFAGGTTFFEFYERGLLSDVETLVDLEDAGLSYVLESSDCYRIGSYTTLESLRRNGLFDGPQYGAVKEALNKVKPIQVRNVATIGGSLCSAVPLYDPPIALCALNASASIVGTDQERIESVTEFAKGFLAPDLNPGEILKEIRIPKYSRGVGSSFLKLGRSGFDYGIVTVASLVETDDDRACSNVRIFLGNYDEKPFRAADVEKTLVEKEATPSLVEKAVAALDDTSPAPSIHASSEYKKEIAKVLVAQSLLTSYGRASGLR